MARITGPAIISTDTLRTRDLIPAFMWALEDRAPETAAKLRKEYAEVFEALDSLDHFLDPIPTLAQDDAGFLLAELDDALNEHAPAGCYFGASDGDGACFGFWSFEEEDEC